MRNQPEHLKERDEGAKILGGSLQSDLIAKFPHALVECGFAYTAPVGSLLLKGVYLYLPIFTPYQSILHLQMTVPMSSLPGACHVGGLAFADQHHLQFDHSPRYHGRRSEGFEVTHELDHVTWPWLGP